MKVAEVRVFYTDQARKMFRKGSLFTRHLYKYRAVELKAILQQASVPRPSSALRSWEDSADGHAATPRRTHFVARVEQPIGQVQIILIPTGLQPQALPFGESLSASTAAPTTSSRPGARTCRKRSSSSWGRARSSPYNNPAFQLFLMATLKAYRLNWPTGEDKLLLVSVGSGADSYADKTLRPSRMNLLYHALGLPLVLMAGANVEQDLLCRAFGRCVFGEPIDSEVGDLQGDDGEGVVDPKLFTYVRYNVELSRSGLDSMKLGDIRMKDVSCCLDAFHHIDALRRIGQGAAGKVQKAHFAKFLF